MQDVWWNVCFAVLRGLNKWSNVKLCRAQSDMDGVDAQRADIFVQYMGMACALPPHPPHHPGVGLFRTGLGMQVWGCILIENSNGLNRCNASEQAQAH